MPDFRFRIYILGFRISMPDFRWRSVHPKMAGYFGALSTTEPECTPQNGWVFRRTLADRAGVYTPKWLATIWKHDFFLIFLVFVSFVPLSSVVRGWNIEVRVQLQVQVQVQVQVSAVSVPPTSSSSCSEQNERRQFQFQFQF